MLERCMDLAPLSCFATWGCELASNCQCHALFDAHLILYFSLSHLVTIFCYALPCLVVMFLLCQLCKVPDPESFDFQTVVSQMSPTVFLGTLGWFHLKEQCRAQQRGLFKDACISSVACILHFFAFIFCVTISILASSPAFCEGSISSSFGQCLVCLFRQNAWSHKGWSHRMLRRGIWSVCGTPECKSLSVCKHTR